MRRMNSKARRTNRETTPLPVHNERDAENRPYQKFIVDDATSPTPSYSREGKWEDWSYVYYLSFNNAHSWGYYQTSNPCSNGYRIPNQRELLIMSTRMPETAWPTYQVEASGGLFGEPEVSSKAYYISQTAFSMDGQSPYNNNRDAFLWNAENDVFMLQNNTDERGYVRCIRDSDN